MPIMILISEKLIKNRIVPTLKQHMTSFQTGAIKGKGVVDNYSFCVVQLTTADTLVENYGLHFMTLKSVLIASG